MSWSQGNALALYLFNQSRICLAEKAVIRCYSVRPSYIQGAFIPLYPMLLDPSPPNMIMHLLPLHLKTSIFSILQQEVSFHILQQLHIDYLMNQILHGFQLKILCVFSCYMVGTIKSPRDLQAVLNSKKNPHVR